jgi:hypothetical protein
MRPRAHVVGAVTTAVLLVLGAHAAADPAPAPPAMPPITYYKIDTPAHLTTTGGTDLQLPPGYYLPEPAWDAMDAEMRRLQDAETRLTAENGSLKASASGWQPGWKTLLTVVVLGAAGGWYLHDKL